MSNDQIPAGYPEPLAEPTDDEIEADQRLRRGLPEAQEDGIPVPHEGH